LPQIEGPPGAMIAATDDTVLEAVLRRDRQLVVAALIAVIAIAWLWILLGAGTGMSAMDMILGLSPDGMAGMLAPAAWTLGYAGIMFTMWWVMMAAMMLPSAAPILLLFARINRKEKSAGRPFISTGIFAAGYLVAWGAFSALATGLQWELERLGLLSPMMATTSYWLGGAIPLAAGVWQLTPIKGICLRHCRSPIGFLVQSWRPGRGGAFRMGLEHGSFCLGCCWFLMGLLFFGGIMNLFWIIGLAAFVLLEKTVPMGSWTWIGRILGVGVAAWGVLLLATTTLTIAAPSDYHFEVVDTLASGPGKTKIAVRLVRASDNKPIDGAVIVEAKTDMGPAGMAEMFGKVTPVASDRPGLYRFWIETGMAGKWELLLTAKLLGETAPITGRVIYDAQ
jgi:predicted metal-binding membrane protein